MEMEKTQINYPLRVLMTRQDFTVIEKRIFLKAFTQIEQGFNLQRDLFDSEIEVYLNYNDLDETNWERVKKAVRKLSTRTIEPIDNDERLVGKNWTSGYDIRKGRDLKITFNQKINDVLMELSRGYTKLQLELMLSLGSEYSQRLYEFLSHWYDVRRKEPFDLFEIRENLKVPSSYNLSKFKERVLDYSKRELEEKTNIKFDYELLKIRSRSFNYIQFFIKKVNIDSGYKPKGLDIEGLDEKSRKCYLKAKEYGVFYGNDLRVIVENKQKEFWKLHYNYQTLDITPSAGKVLVDLGLRESKY